MNAVTEMNNLLVFTENAANKVKQLIDEEGNPDLKLRVFVSGGGCSHRMNHRSSPPTRVTNPRRFFKAQ